MADVVDRATRSRMMAGIKGKDTRAEVRVRSYLHRHGFRFRLHGRHLPGRPDIVLAKYQTVIFVHGCFWHRHAGCRFAYLPKSNARFWRNKLESNARRDLRQQTALRRAGWRVVVVWECQIGDRKLGTVARVLRRGPAA